MKQISSTLFLSSAPHGVRLAVSAGYITVIALLSLLPAKTFENIEPPFASFDKLVHLLMYGGMAFVLCWTFEPVDRKSRKHLVAIFFFCAGFGMSMEVLQGIFTQLNRSFSWADEAANIMGTLISLFAWKPIGQRLKKVS